MGESYILETDKKFSFNINEKFFISIISLLKKEGLVQKLSIIKVSKMQLKEIPKIKIIENEKLNFSLEAKEAI